MKVKSPKILFFSIVTLCIIFSLLLTVKAASKSIEYDTAAGTIYDINANIDSTKIPDGNNTFEVGIKIKQLSPDSVSIHNIQFFFRIEPYISDVGSTADILTENGMSSTAMLMFEYNSSWGIVDLEILIKFQEEVYNGEILVTHYYETNWINVFTLKPGTGGASWSGFTGFVSLALMGISLVLFRKKFY